MDNRIGELQVFLRVVETGSFSEAGRALLTTPSTVSKLIARMEARLGVRLMERSTRALSLTDEGKLVYERGKALVANFEELELDIAKGASQARGTVRVNASIGFGTMGLVPLLPAFWDAHPNIVVDLSVSDELVDLYLDRTDIAFRIGTLVDSNLISRRLGAAQRKIVASPAYLERHGTPNAVEDLDQHNCLGFNFRRAAPVWPLREAGAVVNRTVRHLAIAGAGLARLGEYHVRDDIADGRLVEVLAEAGCGDEEEIHALYIGGPLMPQRVRLFLDFFVPRLQRFIADDLAADPGPSGGHRPTSRPSMI
jgi:DNA-binding transcriptional LysR family regulator